VWAAASSTAFDYFALLATLRAVGANPHPSLVLLAYTAAELLALLPLTPGGLGFVEAGLVGTLTLAGVPSADALAATLLYRTVAYWLPLPAGGIAYLLFRHRYDTGKPGEVTRRPQTHDQDAVGVRHGDTGEVQVGLSPGIPTCATLRLATPTATAPDAVRSRRFLSSP
jgi:hypothetical protein